MFRQPNTMSGLTWYKNNVNNYSDEQQMEFQILKKEFAGIMVTKEICNYGINQHLKAIRTSINKYNHFIENEASIIANKIKALELLSNRQWGIDQKLYAILCKLAEVFGRRIPPPFPVN